MFKIHLSYTTLPYLYLYLLPFTFIPVLPYTLVGQNVSEQFLFSDRLCGMWRIFELFKGSSLSHISNL